MTDLEEYKHLFDKFHITYEIEQNDDEPDVITLYVGGNYAGLWITFTKDGKFKLWNMEG